MTQDDPSYYLQSIGAYHPETREHFVKLLKNIGFICLREQKRTDGLWRWIKQQYWEIWYIPGAWSAKGELKNCTPKQLRNWIMLNSGAGSVSIEGEYWGACAE